MQKCRVSRNKYGTRKVGIQVTDKMNRTLTLASTAGKAKHVQAMLQHILAHFEKTLVQNSSSVRRHREILE